LSLSESFKRQLGLGTTSEDLKEYMQICKRLRVLCQTVINVTKYWSDQSATRQFKAVALAIANIPEYITCFWRL